MKYKTLSCDNVNKPVSVFKQLMAMRDC